MKVVVIGNGMVGYKFCEKLRKKAGADQISITVYGEEPRPAYDRVHLSEYFNGKSAKDLLLAPAAWYAENQVKLVTGELVTAIDRGRKTVTTHKGNIAQYDKLVLATGSSAFVPRIKGIDKQGVFVYRTIEDLNAILAYGKKVHKAAVMGGGLLGLEAAKAMLDMGLQTEVVEFAPRLMPRQLDERGAELLRQRLEALSITIHTNKNTVELAGDQALRGLKFADGSFLEAAMLVISAGIRPRDELARNSGLATGGRGGIIVNDQLLTNDPDIYTIGEAALHNNMIYGLVAPGYEMAECVAASLAGQESRTFSGFDMSAKLKLIGVDVGSFGDPSGEQVPAVPIIYEDKSKGIYKRINISADGKQLCGGILVGDTTSYNMLLQITQNGLPLPADPSELILGARGKENEGGAGVESLPGTAQICSCENISKEAICSAIEEQGLSTLDEVKKATGACTGCGGCTPMVADLLKYLLEAQGKTVKKVVCEHFDYSRQELLDLIRVNSFRSYDQLLDACGKGDGCEICKPVVASLLSSAWNVPVPEHSTIQDTNDRFLANIQKGGSYSVVPRIPAGEITPRQLMVIASVAEKYGLYTKITGGQRIDLFGASLEQLPAIWKELTDAGFESGHAYGKALRTVKSCVGSTWCRYGVQDSVSFAVEIEQRYKGIRAPHKLKSAVSGCIRECAEAQSKDFGIIATEKGWNLYVCGNGGSRPQHAKLLVTDAGKESCIRYIDRFLMFYIKTADPLTRTAAWLNKLEGGIDYLKDVIVNDSLGIGAQLEKEIQELIDSYHCEWKKVVDSPALQAGFRHFLNSGETDPAMQFTEMRGQKVPLDWEK
ncbi:assimilatory nitrite reductase (NAD(P)H) large subunit precursor [Anseongella ginsenosidimutans]|uniref:Assimilatory nitrite reductase (NAD(P)H) large subunit n=1 Tax=Anseongella ginsenosidimutans TaxID=496056 RepID=A0A4R3KWK3_9SPHI|nr:nitrite reductase large subunit NirB [Anseongella ginsenosidimutans]QEC51170.1 nitrite reductase large subunit [Anseongella ginsenosidimutans]TCS90159.1 assimilatory nitrite reductase (NAD(P)H) large subunit precursor [Anseongella ginsenosidimutans]